MEKEQLEWEENEITIKEAVFIRTLRDQVYNVSIKKNISSGILFAIGFWIVTFLLGLLISLLFGGAIFGLLSQIFWWSKMNSEKINKILEVKKNTIGIVGLCFSVFVLINMLNNGFAFKIFPNIIHSLSSILILTILGIIFGIISLIKKERSKVFGILSIIIGLIFPVVLVVSLVINVR